MKVPSFKVVQSGRPFVKTDALQITVLRNDNDTRITGFEVVAKGQKKSFPVKKMEVLKAWQQLEKYVIKI